MDMMWLDGELVVNEQQAEVPEAQSDLAQQTLKARITLISLL